MYHKTSKENIHVQKANHMRKIKEILRLKLECGFSDRKVSASCHSYKLGKPGEDW